MPEEWEACLDSWLLLTHHHLLLPEKSFTLTASKNLSLVQFVVSYVKNSSESIAPKAKSLRKNCFLLAHRLLTNTKPTPLPLFDWNFLANLSRVYAKNSVMSSLLNGFWQQESLDESVSLRHHKSNIISLLEGNHVNSDVDELLPQVVALLRVCYCYGQFLMLGSDFFDSVAAAYDRVQDNSQRKKLIVMTYFSLVSLMDPDRPQISCLLDHLYSLNSSTHVSSLLQAVVESTPLLQKFRTQIIGAEAGRAKSLMESLQKFEKTPDGRPKKPVRKKINKGKGKSRDGYGRNVLSDVHVHKLSLVSQVQDLFPDLGSGFIVKLLDEYGDDTEQVTAHLLDNNLPPHLMGADRSKAISHGAPPRKHELAPRLAPHITPPLLPTRRNIHDDDDFDRLAVDTSRLALGRKNANLTADELLASQRPSNQKAAILSALAAFDSDDDERDDTYDFGDVGGTIDTTNDENAADLKQDLHEEALFNAYKMSPEAFARDSDTRRGKYRAALKSETGMTDEAIEGWAIMIGRDPGRLRRLEARFEMGGGVATQTQLGRSSWTADSATEGTEDSDVGRSTKTGRGGRGRGRGRGRGSGGVAGPSDDKATHDARHGKDVNKGSRANHNRRDQRARKIARGFAG